MHKILRAESREPRAESREPRAESREPRAESREPRAESREPRAESREPRAESREPRAESREPRAESREPRAESREPRAESREPSCTAELSRPARASAPSALWCGRTFLLAVFVLASLVFLSGGNAQAQGSVAEDRAALVALYNATDGPNWTNNTHLSRAE